MSIKSFLIVGSAFVSSLAFAQGAVLGKVGDVQGLVTDSDGTTVSSTVPGEPIRDGERFVTSSNGTVTLRFDNGCTLTLQPNQAVTVDSRMTCRELIAAISPVSGLPVVAGAGGTRAGGLLGVAALTAAYFAIDRALGKNPNVSGN